MARRYSSEYKALQPFIVEDVRRIVQSAGVTSGTGGGGGVVDHGSLAGLNDDDHTQYLTANRGDARYVPLARTITAGDGLSGGGALTANLTLAVNTGTGLEIVSDAVRIASSAAGAGLGYSAGVLSVNAGTLISTAGDAVGIASGTAWQMLGTDAAGAPLYRNVSALAGDGLTATSGVLAVNTGNGLQIVSDAIALTTPGTLDVSTSNSAAGSHTHAITSTDKPGTAASLLSTNSAGGLTLHTGYFSSAARSSGFSPGWTGNGWRINYDSTLAKAAAEFDDLTVRGTMRIYELLIQQICATNGSVFVSSASKVVSVTTEVNPLWTVTGGQLVLGGSDANFGATIYQIATAATGDTGRELYHGFLYGDLIRSQQVQWSGSAYTNVRLSNLEVTGVTDLYNYQAALVSGDDPVTSADYVRLGSATNSNRRGSVYLTADEATAPYMDIVDDVRSHADWGAAGKIKVRVGKLTGISDSDFGGALSGYGLYGNNVYLKGEIVVTGGSLGGLAAGDVNSNTTTIDGGKITANTITANQIAANAITTSELNFTPVLTGNVVASINATAEGLRIAGNRIQIDGDVTFASGYNPTTKIAAGGAAADVNANTTTISGGKITANSIAADRLSVASLSAITAYLGTVYAGTARNRIVINDTNLGLTYSGDYNGATYGSAGRLVWYLDPEASTGKTFEMYIADNYGTVYAPETPFTSRDHALWLKSTNSAIPQVVLSNSNQTTIAKVWHDGYHGGGTANVTFNAITGSALSLTGALTLNSGQYADVANYGRVWSPGQQVSATNTGTSGVTLTYNAQYSSGWKGLTTGRPMAAGVTENLFWVAGSNAAVSANGTVAWTTRLTVNAAGDLNVTGSFSLTGNAAVTGNLTLTGNAGEAWTTSGVSWTGSNGGAVSGRQTFGFRKLGDLVLFKGSAALDGSGSGDVQIGTMPLGYRPANTVSWATITATGVTVLYVNSSGEIRMTSKAGGQNYITFDGMFYPV